MATKKKNTNVSKIIFLTVAISLIVGAAAGLFGALFLTPYLSGQQKQQQKNSIIEIEQESAVINSVEQISPAVVSIIVTKEVEKYYNQTGPFSFFDHFFRQNSQQAKEEEKVEQQVGGGTGFLVTEDGLILTNKHVVSDTEASYTVFLNDNTQYEAKVLDMDVIHDLAVLKIDGQDLPIVNLGDSEQIKIGQTVIAIGYSLGEYQNTVTKGVVSGINRTITAGTSLFDTETIEEAIQTDAAINPGNSGGPLLNLQGEVIGINTAVNRNGEAIGFAIPINVAKRVVDSVKEFGEIIRPWLGVRYAMINEQNAQANDLPVDYGALLLPGENEDDLAVVSGSPADKAGLQENDIILSINNVKLDERSLAYELLNYSPGDIIELKILRDSQEKTVSVILEKRPD